MQLKEVNADHIILNSEKSVLDNYSGDLNSKLVRYSNGLKTVLWLNGPLFKPCLE